MTLPFTNPSLVFMVLFAVILLAPVIGERLRLPGVVALVLAGLAVGPNGFGLIERTGAVEDIGAIGLLYLMFLAGLELDFRELVRRRRLAAAFSLTTFAFPIGLGFLAAWLLGYSALASILIGSLWASHTLVVYPLVRRHGIARTRSVAVTVAATTATDTAALLVLAVVAEVHKAGRLDVATAGRVVFGLLALVMVTVWLVPKASALFFAGVGQDRTLRFVFVLLALFVGSGTAVAAGLEPILGAFLVGLSLNRVVPSGGVLMERIEFLGASFLIPIFLVSVGMIIDPFVAIEPETLGVAAAFTAVALASKLLAAWVVGRPAGFTRPEILTMFSLSGAQAAATLAATIVGRTIGLLDDVTVNAVLLVILGTVIVTSLVAQRAMPSVSPDTPSLDHIGRHVVVPVSHPENAGPLIGLASRIAAPERGIVAPAHIVVEGLATAATAAAEIVPRMERTAGSLGIETRISIRIDDSVATGIIRAAAESLATLVVLGLPSQPSLPQLVLGGIVADVTERSPIPVAVAAPQPEPFRRVVLAIEPDLLEPARSADLALVLEIGRRLAAGLRHPATVVAAARDERLTDVAAAMGPRTELATDSGLHTAAGSVVGPGDVVVTNAPSGRLTELRGIAAAVSEVEGVSVVVVVPGHHADSGRPVDRVGIPSLGD